MKDIAYEIKKGKIGVFPTDTLYGLIGSALLKKAVKRIYAARKRDLKKPLIILVASIDDIAKFGIILSLHVKKFLKLLWPGKVSVVLQCNNKKFSYLHRGTKTLAFRIPKNKKLLKLLVNAGPIVAPSANIQGYPFSKTILQAKKYFKANIDFYIDGGKLLGSASTVIQIIENNDIMLLRKGAVSFTRIEKLWELSK